jgi:hypothetical protein
MRAICVILEKVLHRQARILSNQNQIIERIENMSEVLDQVKRRRERVDLAERGRSCFTAGVTSWKSYRN